MRVVVTGGTGFVGQAIVEELLREGHQVTVLEHRQRAHAAGEERLERVPGDVGNVESLRRAFEGKEALVHLVGIREEKAAKGITFERMHVDATRDVCETARAAGIRRLLHMSANGAEARDTPYFRTKWDAEQIVRASGLDWTIFRPSFVSGGAEGGFDSEFAAIVDRFPVLPSFGGGEFEIQPVARKNVAQAFARALTRPVAIGKTYVLVGPERMTWNTYLRRLAAMRGRKRMLVPAPRWLVIPAATLMGRLAPASADEIRMLLAGNVGDPAEARADLDLQLIRWEDACAALERAPSMAHGPTGRARRPQA